jgi:hypothetical protein
MNIKIIPFILLFLFLCSCYEEGKVVVENKVSNARLESINYANNSIWYSLLPGEKSEEVEIRDRRDAFPKSGQLEFYMVAKGNRVYLKTQSVYLLDYGETLSITVTDSTKVINPLID